MIVKNYCCSPLLKNPVRMGEVMVKNQTEYTNSDLTRKDIECTTVTVFALDRVVFS